MFDWLSSEAKILERIANDPQTLANTIRFALNSAFPFPEHPFSKNIYIATNVLRSKLNLNPDEKPGDIDYMIVPFDDNGIFFERTIAIEAKVLRPSIKNPARNVNTMGGSQARGLLRDGFPFVGLVHMSFPEPLPEKMRWLIPEISYKSDSSGNPVKTGQYFIYDPFPLSSAIRQEGRLNALSLPPYIAHKVIAMTLTADGTKFYGNTIGEEKQGLRNPTPSKQLINSIQNLMQKEPQIFKKIFWHEKHHN